MSEPISHIGAHKVMVDQVGIALFNARWPCSNLRTTRHYWFEFDSDGNLIDCDVPQHDDGDAAHALMEDCRAWLFDNVQPEWLP